MPDWNAFVSQWLSLSELSQEQQNETIAELASHLDDHYQECRAHGLSESEAVARAIREVNDWCLLAQTIQRAKLKEETMNTRTKHLWLPGLVSLTTAMFSPMLVALMRLGHLPQHLWMVLLPMCGGAAAYLSRRSGGQRFERIVSALFPVGALLACFCFVLLMSTFATVQFFTLSDFAHYTKWALPQGAALLLGALPFLRSGKRGNRIGSVMVRY
jgi:hypothetical protein